MNLTSKRVLQFLTVCAGACAFTASAQTTWVADNFEPEGDGYTNATIGSAASDYKMLVWGGPSLNWYTNVAWAATAGDASTVQANTNTYGAASPMDSTDTQYLKLETEGQTLTRYVNFAVTNTVEGVDQTEPTTISYSTAPVYVDTLIKFTPSEDAPEITDPNVKIAIYVNVNSNLVVCHKYTDGDTFIATNSVFESLGVLDPDTWHRLTIKMAYNEIEQESFYTGAFHIWLDGTLLAHANGAVNVSTYSGGSIFFSLVDSSTDLSQVSFQGTGSVDELVVSDIEPDLGGGSVFMLTLSFNESMIDVTTGGVAVANNVSVPSDTALVIAAKPWYEITGLGDYFTGGTTTNMVAGTSMITNINGTVSVTAESLVNTITAALFSSSTGISTGMGGSYPADKVAAWAIASGLTPDQLIADYLDNYLLNVDETVNASLEIQSIVYDSNTGDATIVVGSASDLVPMNDLNGTLIIKTTDALGNAWSTPAITTNSLTATSMSVTVPTGNNFMKATVE